MHTCLSGVFTNRPVTPGVVAVHTCLNGVFTNRPVTPGV